MDYFLLVISVTIINIILSIGVIAFGFGLVGLAFFYGSNRKEGRSFAFKLFGWGWIGFAFSFIAGYILALLNTQINYPVLLILTFISGAIAFYSFKKANKYENNQKA